MSLPFHIDNNMIIVMKQWDVIQPLFAKKDGFQAIQHGRKRARGVEKLIMEDSEIKWNEKRFIEGRKDVTFAEFLNN